MITIVSVRDQELLGISPDGRHKDQTDWHTETPRGAVVHQPDQNGNVVYGTDDRCAICRGEINQ